MDESQIGSTRKWVHLTGKKKAPRNYISQVSWCCCSLRRGSVGPLSTITPAKGIMGGGGEPVSSFSCVRLDPLRGCKPSKTFCRIRIKWGTDTPCLLLQTRQTPPPPTSKGATKPMAAEQGMAGNLCWVRQWHHTQQNACGHRTTGTLEVAASSDPRLS